MNKADLVRAIAEEVGTTNRSAEAMVNAFTDVVVRAVSEGDKVSLVGFGSFASAVRQARTGRNPATGKTINIPAKKVPKFAPGKEFRDSVK